MTLTFKSDLSSSLDLSFLTSDLLDAINSTNIGRGTPLNPILMDGFVKNRLNGIPVIKAGEEISLQLSGDSNIIKPQLIYGEIQNITQGHNGYMSKEDWLQFFEWDDTDKTKVVSPNGILYVKPDSEGVCRIQSKTSIQDIIIYYGVVICFTYNNVICYGKVDPLAKISSGGGGEI